MTLPMSVSSENLKRNIEAISQFTSNSEQPEAVLVRASENINGDKAEVSGHININYDFSNSTLHGNLEVFVDAAEGMICRSSIIVLEQTFRVTEYGPGTL